MFKDLLLKITSVIAFLAALVFVVLLTNYVANEKMIEKYNNKQYEENVFSILGFTQEYIAPYNLGNVYYKQGEYDQAAAQFQQTISLNPPEPVDCQARINLVLSLTAELDIDSLEPEDIDDTIDFLEDCIDILCENGCAADKKSASHNEEAMKLKEDIEELIEQLQNSQSGEGEDGDNFQPVDDSGDGDDGGSAPSDTEDYYNNIIDEGTSEHIGGTGGTSYIYNWEYYDGIVW